MLSDEIDVRAPKGTKGCPKDRLRLSPELSELLNMLDAFEKSLASEAAFAAR
jgi:hypothetical protein